MNQREAMNLSASANFYVPRGNAESVMGLQDSTIMHPLSMQNLHFASNSMSSLMGSTLPLDSASTMSSHGVSLGPPSTTMQGEPIKRKRGRPRKYGRDSAVSPALLPSSPNPMSTASPSHKKRGRPPGTGQKQQLSSFGGSLISVGGSLIPHIIHVEKGEDIKRKIQSFFGQGQRAIVVLSGVGSISTVNCRSSNSRGTITYEGRFDMLHLSGSYMLSDDNGGLNVTLAAPDGRVIGGCVEGVLIAASPVQIIVGSMSMQNVSKTQSKTDESILTSGDHNSQNFVIPVAPSAIHPAQNLTHLAGWPNL